MEQLTPRQKQILDYITKYARDHNYFPSYNEIKKHFKLSSVATIHEHIETLKQKGFLDREPNQPRGFKLLKHPSISTIAIPLVGTIAAGEPIEAVETQEMLNVPKDMLSRAGQHYALKVKGNSMIEEGIYDGDTVIIRKQETADNGQTVVAVIDENEATLKKIFREKNRIRLQPANPTLFPIYRSEVTIRGIVIKVIRNFSGSSSPLPTTSLQDKAIDSTTDTDSIFTTNKMRLNHIYNMNCLDLMKTVKDGSVDLIFADPPYNLSKSNFKMKFARSGGKDLNTNKGEWDQFSTNEDFYVFTKSWLKECHRILKHNGAIWVAGTYHNIYLTGYLLHKIGYEILNEILWHKSDATPNLSCTRFVADHENFIWARKGKKNTFNYDKMKLMNNNKQMRSIWTRGKTAGGKKIHPTQKPEWLLERIIIATSNPEDVIFDPFIGSGTTAVVAKRLGRKYFGAEISSEYYKMALERVHQQ